MKKLLLIDGNTLIFRAYYATQANPMITTTGIHTNAVHGFINMFEAVMRNEKPDHVFVAFDAGKKTFRHEKYDFYKAHRKPVDEELKVQFPLIREYLDAANISWMETEGFEADDIIGIICKKHYNDFKKIHVLTGDKDLLQLINDKVEIITLNKGVSNFKLFTEKVFIEEYGLNPIQMIDLKAIQGDPSDNIPGIKGIGIKGATKLLQEFGDIETIYDSLDAIKTSKQKEYLIEYKKDAFISKELATIFTDDTEFDIDLSTTHLNEPNFEMLEKFYIKLEMKSKLKQTIFQQPKEELIPTINIVKSVHEFNHDWNNVIINVEAPGHDYQKREILGISIYSEGEAFFVPSLLLKESLIKTWLEDDKVIKSTFDFKKAYVVLNNIGIKLAGVNFDFLLAGYTINSNRQYVQISDLEILYDSHKALDETDLYGKTFTKIAKLNAGQVANLSNSKVLALAAIEDPIKDKLELENLYSVYDLEFSTCKVLINMETNGICVDLDHWDMMTKDYEFQVDNLKQQILSHSDHDFNIDSPKQLGEFLFEQLGLPSGKKTKTGYSTAQEVLEQLADKHEVIPYILAYRQKIKILTTYLQGMRDYVLEDNKIHTVYNQALTRTGRLSSSYPNLQNIPTRSDETKELRRLFIASPGCKLMSIDYSQIELRMVAHLAKEETLIDDFIQGKDIHKETASRIFSIPVDEVTYKQRSYAKATNFGIIYGLSAHGLAKQIGVNRFDAQDFIDKYFKTYPKIASYMQEVYEGAKLNGYVTTIIGRKRYIPEINSPNYLARESAKRAAINAPVQGSAADLLKISMVKIFQAMQDQNLQSKMLLQIHDELVFDIVAGEEDVVEKLAKDIMESSMDLRVPLDAEYKFGISLFETK